MGSKLKVRPLFNSYSYSCASPQSIIRFHEEESLSLICEHFSSTIEVLPEEEQREARGL